MVNILAANGSILHALLGSRWQLTDDSTYVASTYICSCMCMVVVYVRLLAWKDIYLCFLLIIHACILGGSVSNQAVPSPSDAPR